MSLKKYEYRPQLISTLLIIVFFGACGGFLAHQALNNEVGLVLNGIIRFDAGGATLFYWVLAALSFIFVAIGALMLFQRFTGGEQFLEIYEGHFIVPKSGFNKEKTVHYKSVKTIQKQDVKGTITLTFVTDESKAAVTNRNFKSKSEFEDAVNELVRRCSP